MNNSLLELTTTATSGHVRTTVVAGHSQNDQAEDEVSQTQRIVVMCMLAVFSVIGTVGNALAIYVFASLKQKLTSTVFILTLAGTDFLTCLITIPVTMYMEYVDHFASSEVECKIYSFLSTTTVPFSAVVMVAIAADRYMCICHPFNHWMTIQRARIIIGILVIIIFMFGGVICLHHTIHFPMQVDSNMTTAAILAQGSLDSGGGLYDSLANHTLGLYNTVHAFYNDTDNVDGNGNGGGDGVVGGLGYASSSISSGSGGNSDDSGSSSSGSSSNGTSGIHLAGTKRSAVMNNHQCDINWDYIDAEFMEIFRNVYTGIFAVSCIIVLVLYSLIYRYVISQRKKKLRIKSAQCCLLWNATSVETPHEAVEMTQDIELSNVNGDRYNTRLNSTDDTNAEGHNNVSTRKCSISKARIERMRVANIKTAFTLFIVTLVFIIAFLPAWLMALKMLTMQVILFYMHFIYNVSNPLIYAFLNQNFRAELRRIARCGKH